MFYVTDKTALDAAIKFARENGSASRETTKSGNNGLEDYIPYLDRYGSQTAEGNTPDPTYMVIRAYPTTSFGLHSFALMWFVRRDGAKILTEEEVKNILGQDNWVQDFKEFYTPWMHGGLVYHPDSNEWSVHT